MVDGAADGAGTEDGAVDGFDGGDGAGGEGLERGVVGGDDGAGVAVGFFGKREKGLVELEGKGGARERGREGEMEGGKEEGLRVMKSWE